MVNVYVQFTVETADEAQAALDAMSIPDGANVTVTETNQILFGTVAEGKVVEPTPPEIDEPTATEAE